MADYNKMYHFLFNKITDIIKELEEIQCEAEQMFIDSKDDIVKLHVVENKKPS